MSLQYIEELSLSHLLTEDDIDVLTRYPKFLIGWHEFFIPYILKNILKYYYKSCWDDYLDGTHNWTSDCAFYPYYPMNEYAYSWGDNGLLNRPDDKPAVIYSYGTLNWRVNHKWFNSSGPCNINIVDGKLLYVEFNDLTHLLFMNSLRYDNYSLEYSYINKYFILKYKNNEITNISDDEALAIIAKYLPVEENKSLLSLPAIII